MKYSSPASPSNRKEGRRKKGKFFWKGVICRDWINQPFSIDRKRNSIKWLNYHLTGPKNQFTFSLFSSSCRLHNNPSLAVRSGCLVSCGPSLPPPRIVISSLCQPPTSLPEQSWIIFDNTLRMGVTSTRTRNHFPPPTLLFLLHPY